MTSLYDQDDDTIERFEESAIQHLIDSVRIPLSDDVWATDKYSDIIAQTAQEMWEDHLHEETQK